MENNIPVLIVGAGPCGLTAAAFLTHYGIRCRIIDKKSGPTQTSNAVGVHARTLELFEELELTPYFLAAGLCADRGCLFLNRKPVAVMPLYLVLSQYNFICDIPQNHTEVILIEYLKKRSVMVEYNIAADGLQQTAASASITVTNSAGHQEIITADWVIAADGYHSTVREALQIPYRGKEFNFRFLMIDAPIESEHLGNSMAFGITEKFTSMIFPMQNSARIIVEISKTHDYDDAPLTAETFNKFLAESLPFPVKVSAPLWQSKFFVHERLAQDYRKDRVFLLGDAVHVHIPAAAQGMNTGMQDAINLSWKLAQVIKITARPALLDTYQEERRSVAQEVLHMTEMMGKVTLNQKPLMKIVRRCVFGIISRVKFLQKKAATKIAQLAVNYRHSSLTQGKKLADLIPGNRFAMMPLKPLQGKYLVLDFTGDLVDSAINSKIALIHKVSAQEKNQYFPKVKQGYCVIRPDRYIGCIATSTRELQQYFSYVENR